MFFYEGSEALVKVHVAFHKVLEHRSRERINRLVKDTSKFRSKPAGKAERNRDRIPLIYDFKFREKMASEIILSFLLRHEGEIISVFFDCRKTEKEVVNCGDDKEIFRH